jgi:hypothetical protein
MISAKPILFFSIVATAATTMIYILAALAPYQKDSNANASAATPSFRNNNNDDNHQKLRKDKPKSGFPFDTTARATLPSRNPPKTQIPLLLVPLQVPNQNAGGDKERE